MMLNTLKTVALNALEIYVTFIALRSCFTPLWRALS